MSLINGMSLLAKELCIMNYELCIILPFSFGDLRKLFEMVSFTHYDIRNLYFHILLFHTIKCIFYTKQVRFLYDFLFTSLLFFIFAK